MFKTTLDSISIICVLQTICVENNFVKTILVPVEQLNLEHFCIECYFCAF